MLAKQGLSTPQISIFDSPVSQADVGDIDLLLREIERLLVVLLVLG